MSKEDARPLEQPGASSSTSGTGTGVGDFPEVVASLLQNAKYETEVGNLTENHTVDEMITRMGAGNDARAKKVTIGNICRTMTVKGKMITEINLQSKKDEHDSVDVDHNSGDVEHDGFLTDLKKKLSSNGDCYKLANESGALVINNVFNEPERDAGYRKWYRKGAEGDTEKVNRLFKDTLKFAFVQKEENVPSERLEEIIDNFRKTAKLFRCSACFLMIMSHGGKAADSIVMDDLKEVDLYQHIVYKFSDHDDVRALPKVFLVQACRDSREPPVVQDSSPPNAGGHIQDVLIGHSTIPHFMARRDEQKGALYFEVIDQVFRKNAKKSTLKAMLYDVFCQLLRHHGQKAQIQDIGFKDYRFKL